jgi:uncharacterized protein
MSHVVTVTAAPPASRAGSSGAVLATIGALVVIALIGHFGPRHSMLVGGPLGAVLLVLLGHFGGLRAEAMGMGRRSWRRGAAYGAVCVAVVVAVYAVAVQMPATRSAFHDQRYPADIGSALVTAFVVVPIGTVLFEEVAFRGVLWALVCSRHGAAPATVVSSLMFGFWHVLPSLRLNRVNPAVADVVGSGPGGQALAVAGAVVFTALAGVLLCELRRRSGSLLAPFGLHWAVNGLGVLVSGSVAR